MILWIDADSFPREARELLRRAAYRHGLPLVLVSNLETGLPAWPGRDSAPGPGPWSIQVPPGDDQADQAILAAVTKPDLVFTRDIVFAALLLEAGITALNDRGQVFDAATIRERLSVRDFMASLRQSGLAEAGRHGYGKRELHDFAAAFDRVLQARLKSQPDGS